jgi:hypothetical protein
MTINRKFFFDHVRAGLYGGSLKQAQVEHLDAILDYWEAKEAANDDRWLAYALGTAYHETDKTFGPIAEYGHGAGRPYGVADAETGQTYYGRGLVQLTWRKNYKICGDLIDVDLVHDPERALELGCAIPIMFKGMERGLFTGKKLADYFHGDVEDWVHARRIINGLDRAEAIAGYARLFYAALSYTK